MAVDNCLRLLLCCCFGLVAVLQADAISVNAAVETNEVFVGEAFVFQIQVQGADNPSKPDLSAISGFQIEELGGQQNNRASISIINGRMSRVVQRGYFFSYRLTPIQPGRQIIPAIEVHVAGKTLHTRSIAIMVKRPQETGDFKLRLALDPVRCYVGQPVVLTITWYIGKNTRNFSFTIPVLNDSRFEHDEFSLQQESGKKYLSLEIAGSKTIASKSTAMLAGKEYLTVQFHKVLIPRQAGNFTLAAATVRCEGLIGYQRRRNDPFADFFNNDFFGGPKGVYKKFVVPSNTPALEVSALPEAGRPSGFSGHIGNYTIATAAKPTEVNIGDPITLTITLSGPQYLSQVAPPDLLRQEDLTRDFKVPKEIAAGVVQGNSKVFTQTIRATHAKIRAIPAIKLPYFDPQRGRYRIARSAPIPLTVRATKIVTARDAEGREATGIKTELQAWSQGIAHNYEDIEVLTNQHYGLATFINRPLWLLPLLAPMLLYLLVLVLIHVRRRASVDPAAAKARKALGQLLCSVQTLESKASPSSLFYQQLLAAMREYLGSKLRISGGAITYGDAESRLREHGVNAAVLKQLQEFFSQGELGCYAGNAGSSVAPAQLLATAIALGKTLEKELKK